MPKPTATQVRCTELRFHPSPQRLCGTTPPQLPTSSPLASNPLASAWLSHFSHPSPLSPPGHCQLGCTLPRDALTSGDSKVTAGRGEGTGSGPASKLPCPMQQLGALEHESAPSSSPAPSSLAGQPVMGSPTSKAPWSPLPCSHRPPTWTIGAPSWNGSPPPRPRHAGTLQIPCAAPSLHVPLRAWHAPQPPPRDSTCSSRRLPVVPNEATRHSTPRLSSTSADSPAEDPPPLTRCAKLVWRSPLPDRRARSPLAPAPQAREGDRRGGGHGTGCSPRCRGGRGAARSRAGCPCGC